jgi:K+/H+ antiporter YhaU regulatory subunit KhtT
VSTYTDILESELMDKCLDIPFENSLYQDESFILNTSYTDARAVRNIGLRLSSKIQALRELEYSMEKAAIEKEQIESKTYSDPFEKRLADLEIRRRESGIAHTQKLLKDTLYQCEHLRAILAKLPKLTRQEFEAQEKQYFIESLTRQAVNLPESVKSLEAMGVKPESGYEFFNQPTLSERLGVSLQTMIPSLDNITRLLGDK